MDMYTVLRVSRYQLMPKVGLVEYHTRYAHLGAVRRKLRFWLGL